MYYFQYTYSEYVKTSFRANFDDAIKLQYTYNEFTCLSITLHE